MVFEGADGAFGGVAAVDAGWGELVVNLLGVKVRDKCCGRFVVQALEGGAESSRDEHFMRSLVRKEYLVACAGRHCFDVNVIRVEAIQDKHVRVAGGGAVRELAGLVGEDLTGGGYTLSIDHVRSGSRGSAGDYRWRCRCCHRRWCWRRWWRRRSHVHPLLVQMSLGDCGRARWVLAYQRGRDLGEG